MLTIKSRSLLHPLVSSWMSWKNGSRSFSLQMHSCITWQKDTSWLNLVWLPLHFMEVSLANGIYWLYNPRDFKYRVRPPSVRHGWHSNDTTLKNVLYLSWKLGSTMISFFLNILAPCHGGPSRWICWARKHQGQTTTAQIPVQAAWTSLATHGPADVSIN